MFEATIFLFSIVPIMIFIAFGIPILVGVLVYRDANKRVDCSPWLWALVAALVPSFIGLIIYAIIRRDYPLKVEYRRYADGYSQQGNYAGYGQQADYSKDNSGETSYSQGEPGEASYEQRFDEAGNPIPVNKPHRGFPTWAKVLLIVGAILLVVGMFAGCGAMFAKLFGYHTMTPDSFFYEF